MLLPVPAAAEWQIKPFVGLAFGGSTTLLDLEQAVGEVNFIYGVNGGVLGEVFGLEGDLSRAPGFFQSGDGLVLGSTTTTVTGNVIVALPKQRFQYTLRPYFVAGAGIIRAKTATSLGLLDLSSTLPAMDLGGGVTGFLNNRVGLGWELRHFRSLKGNGELNGVSVSEERLSFWRVTMAVALRY